MEKYIKEAGKAVASALVACAAYLTGILSGDQGIGDVTFVQWLGLVLFLGGAYGLTYGVRNKNFVRIRP